MTVLPPDPHPMLRWLPSFLLPPVNQISTAPAKPLSNVFQDSTNEAGLTPPSSCILPPASCIPPPVSYLLYPASPLLSPASCLLPLSIASFPGNQGSPQSVRPRVVSQSTPESGRILDVSTRQLRSVVTRLAGRGLTPGEQCVQYR